MELVRELAVRPAAHVLDKILMSVSLVLAPTFWLAKLVVST